MSDLVLNIGNSFVSGAFFEQGKIAHAFSLPSRPLDKDQFKEELAHRKSSLALIGSDNRPADQMASQALRELGIPYSYVTHEELSIGLCVDQPEEVGIDRIANTYGALDLYPNLDCIVIDMGTAVTFDAVSKKRMFLGGAIYPGLRISAQGLADWTDKLPFVEVKKPPHPISTSTTGNIESGLYWGLIGAVERILCEMKKSLPDAMTVATGGLASNNDLKIDLQKIIDHFEPGLTLLGLYQILKERNE